MDTGNIFAAIPDGFDEEIFTPLLKKGSLKIERILSKGQVSPKSGWYDQEQDEWVIVLQGSATIEFEHREPATMERGGYINIPAHTKHRVSWTDPQRVTVWLAVHY